MSVTFTAGTVVAGGEPKQQLFTLEAGTDAIDTLALQRALLAWATSLRHVQKLRLHLSIAANDMHLSRPDYYYNVVDVGVQTIRAACRPSTS